MPSDSGPILALWSTISFSEPACPAHWYHHTPVPADHSLADSAASPPGLLTRAWSSTYVHTQTDHQGMEREVGTISQTLDRLRHQDRTREKESRLTWEEWAAKKQGQRRVGSGLTANVRGPDDMRLQEWEKSATSSRIQIKIFCLVSTNNISQGLLGKYILKIFLKNNS